MTRAGEAPGSSCVRRTLRTVLLGSITNLRIAALTLVVGASVLSAAPALAQQGMAVLVGSVTDSSTGAPVADALVTVTSPSLQGEEIAITDETGTYRVPGLPPGTYLLRVERETYRPYAREALDLHADTTIRLNASLLPEALKAEEVVVVGRTPTVDVGSSATGINITSEFTGRVPLIAPGGKGSAARSFEAVADVAPGAQADAFGTAMFGSSSPENRYLLDGLSVNNPTFGLLGTPLSIDFIKEVSVLSGGYMPEYGRATGGILNAITKSGSNEFHGSVFTNWAPGALAGDPKTVRSEAQTIVTQPSLRYMGDIGGDVGGPIIRDKLWFYLGFDWAQSKYNLKRSLYSRVPQFDPVTGMPLLDADEQPISTPTYIPGSKQMYYAQQDLFQGIGKLTLAVDKSNRLTLTVNGAYPVSGGNGKYGVDPLTGQPEIGTQAIATLNTLSGEYNALAHKYQGKSTNVMLRWNSELDGKRLFLDTWLGYHQESGGRQASDGSKVGSQSGLGGRTNVWSLRPDGSLPDFEMVPGGACDPQQGDPEGFIRCPVNEYRSGGPEFVDFQQTHRIQGRSALTYLFEALGHHVFKAGVDLEYQRHNGVRAYTGKLDFVDYGDLLISQGYGYLTGPDMPVLLDKIENDTQSLSLGGFVQDSWNVADRVTVNLGLRYDAQLLYGRDGQLAMTLPSQWSPRAGVIWDPTNEGHAKLYTNYARYYEQVPLRMLDRYLSGEPLIQATHDPMLCDPTQPGASTGACLAPGAVADGWGYPPDNKYGALSAGTSVVDPKLKAPSTDEFVLGGDYEILRDGRLGLQYTKRWLTNTIEDMSRDEGQTFFFGNPGQGIGKDFPKAERKYDGVTLYFTKMFSQGWLAQASYTLSFLRGNYGGLYRADDLQLDPHQSTDFDLRSLSTNRKGPLPGDNRHYIKLFGAKEVPLPGKWGTVTPGLSLRAYSGGPTNYLGAHPAWGPDLVYILPRGEGERLPWVTSVDLRLAYSLGIAKERGLTATIDVFNLFNFQSAIARDQRYTSAGVSAIPGGTKADLTEEVVATADRNPNFGRASAYQSPRIFRFGLKGTF
jgi:hypothetical protein